MFCSQQFHTLSFKINQTARDFFFFPRNLIIENLSLLLNPVFPTHTDKSVPVNNRECPSGINGAAVRILAIILNNIMLLCMVIREKSEII